MFTPGPLYRSHFQEADQGIASTTSFILAPSGVAQTYMFGEDRSRLTVGCETNQGIDDKPVNCMGEHEHLC